MPKSMFTKDLAALTGVSSRTLQRWISVHRTALADHGYHSSMRKLPPRVVNI